MSPPHPSEISPHTWVPHWPLGVQPQTLGVPLPPHVAPVPGQEVAPDGQQEIWPPQPSATVPQFLPAQASATVLGVQLQTPPGPHVCGAVQVSGHDTTSPQLLTVEPQCPSHVDGEGVQPQTPWTPPPPQVSPTPVHAGQTTLPPQRSVFSPQAPAKQSSDMGWGSQALHSPVATSQSKAQLTSPDHCPVLLQVCDTVPLQRCVLGSQTPTHSPAEQTCSQVSVEEKRPSVSQVFLTSS
jgi:hypothetical protein